MNPLVAGAAAAATIGIPLVVGAVRWAFPARPRAEDDPSVDDMETSYKACDGALTIAWLVCVPIVSYGVYRLIGAACAAAAKLLPPAEIVLVPAGATCGIPAIFIAIVAGFAPAYLLVRLRFGPRYEEYVRYRELRLGVARRGWHVLLAGYSALCVGVVVLMLDWNVRFTDHDIVINRLWSLTEEEHAYSEIVEIRKAWVASRSGKGARYTYRREYLVRFRDGQTWSTDYEPSDAAPERKKQIAQLLSRGSGVPITEVVSLSTDASY